MIKDEKVEWLCRHWAALTSEQKEQIKNKAAKMRLAAMRSAPFVCPGFETFRVDSEIISEMTAESFRDGDGVAPAIEIAMLEELQSPAVIAWEHAYRHLKIALQDDAIKANPVVIQMLENALITAGDAVGHTGPNDIYHSIERASAQKEISKRAAEAAAAKNSKPRAWVLIEWVKRTDRGQSKAAFARQYAPLVKKQFGLIVAPDTIARDWLPTPKN